MANETEVLDSLIPFEMAGDGPTEKEDGFPPFVEETEEEETEPVDETENVDTEAEESDAEVDEQAEAAFALFKDFGVFSDEDIPEKPTLEAFKEKLSGYKEKVIGEILESSSETFRDVLEFANVKKGATRKDLIEYLSQTNSDDIPVVNDVEDAEEFLKRELAMDKKRFKNANAIQTFLDAHEDDEKLEMAKELIREKEEAVAEVRKQKIAEEKAQQEQAKKAQEEYIASLDKEIEATQWTPAKKKEVKQTLLNLQSINQALTQDPKVFTQYLNFLSTFNPKTGEFDQSKYVLRQQTSKVKEAKENIQADAVSSLLTKFTKGKSPTHSGTVDRLRPIS